MSEIIVWHLFLLNYKIFILIIHPGIVNTPTTFNGVRMGEGFTPELVTVQPLTRGTGNHGGLTVSSVVVVEWEEIDQ